MSSAQSFHGPCLQSVVYSLTCGFLGRCHSSTRPPNVQIRFTWTSPALVLQATNIEVRRSGYESKDFEGYILYVYCPRVAIGDIGSHWLVCRFLLQTITLNCSLNTHLPRCYFHNFPDITVLFVPCCW